MATAYKCPNIGNCDKADKSELILLPVGSPTVCPACGSDLISAGGGGAGGAPRWLPIALLGLLLLALIGGAAWYFLGREASVPVCHPPEVLDAATNTCKAPTAAANGCIPPAVLDPATGTCKAPPPAKAVAETLLRFHGSNTIGGKLLPALAEAFLKQEGYGNVHAVGGADEEESYLVGERDGVERQIEIQAHGSRTAFECLKSGRCDIGMSSRPIKPEEKQALSALGDLSSSASEHVLALDGIAVIVHPSNPVRTLTLAQLADVFSGAVTDWSKVGGRAGTIAVYARDEKSGTWDFFNDAVLKRYGKTLTGGARRFEDSGKLSESVGSDPSGIGFIGLNYLGSNKVVGLADAGVEPRKPSLLTIKTEDYLLSRRLFLYTPERPANPDVFKFIEFAVGPAAQPIVKDTGLVNLDVTPLPQAEFDDPRKTSGRWKKLTAGAAEIPTRFRFRTNSDALDNRANRDIGRIAYLLSQPAYRGKEVILIGFADASGSPALNLKLSQNRADIVKKVLAEEGVTVLAAEGLGAEAFVAPNDTDEHKEKNRRVEVWVK